MIDWLACVAVRALGWGLCLIPPEACVWFGARLGWLAYWLQPKRARIGYLNVKAALGERVTPAQARRIIRGVFEQLGAGLIELLRLPAIDRAYVMRYITLVGEPPMRAALASGKPVMFVTAHFGNWELSSITAAFREFPVVALARTQKNLPKLYQLLVSYRESKGCRVVHKGGAARQLVQALQHREPVGIVADQASRQGVLVEFFGRPAWFATGPFKIAQSTGAVLIPSFMHRTHGPYHRLVFGPPFELPKDVSAEQAVQTGLERFTAALAQQIEQEPAHWLWLHKRWKRTPARRVLRLGDGKLGHLKQTEVVLRALQTHTPHIQDHHVEIRFRNRLARVIAILWARLMPRGVGALGCLRLVLTPQCFKQVASRYADIVISCGASTAPINALLSAENQAKSVVIMDPAPLPLRRFTMVFVPFHDQAPTRANVIQTYGALSAVTGHEMRAARERLVAHPRARLAKAQASRGPVIAVLVGGDTREYHVTSEFAETLLEHVLMICEELNGSCLVTTSRRTPPAVERQLTRQLTDHPRCALLLLASRDALNGTVEGMLGWAQVVVVTGESISMMSEACASGRYVVVVEPPLRSGVSRITKSQRHLQMLVRDRYASHHPLPEVSHAIRRYLSERPTMPRLETETVVREAVRRLL